MSWGTPAQYAAAPWMRTAESYIGVKEVRGGENPVILKFFAEAGHSEIDEDEVAWCSAFANAMMYENGIVGTKNLMAKSWLKWSGAVYTDKPVFGDLVIFNRGSDPSQGHVAFYIDQDDSHVTVLGGNQSDSVCVAKLPLRMIAGYRHVIAKPVEGVASLPMPKMTTKQDPVLTPENVAKTVAGAGAISSAFYQNVITGCIVLAVALGVIGYLWWKNRK